MLRRGFTLLEVLLASIMLGVSLAGILVAMSQAQHMMLSQTELETAQEVMDLGEMAYPLESVTDVDDLDVRELRASDLWDEVSEAQMTPAQRDKFAGYTWQRENLDKNPSSDDLERMNHLYRVRITVIWGERGRGSGKTQRESYVTFWKEPQG